MSEAGIRAAAAEIPDDALTACDREPIHVPGAIQPHGLLLVADAASLAVRGGAGDIEARLAADWQARGLDALMGQDVRGALAAAGPAAEDAILLAPVAGTRETFRATAHRAGALLLVELEPAEPAQPPADAVLAALDATIAAFERASTLEALCDRAAIAFRELTGFDRVMIYRFLDDEAGVVIAEDRDPAHGTFRHHHFPASDIPVQARALYVRNRVRTIPDARYVPAPLRPAELAALDLSDVALRSVSPIHVRYLANMGVVASASISIVKDDLLWGLIACHHYAPRALGPGTRAAAKLLAAGLSRQIRARDEAETYRERLRLRAAEDAIAARLTEDESTAAAVGALRDALMRMLDADGFAHVGASAATRAGVCPDARELAALAAWARARTTAEPVATPALGTIYPPAAAAPFRKVASGLLALPLAPEEGVLLWFRAEHLETVEWAGNPHKATAFDPAAILTPRASFETWSETVSGRARRWTLEEIEAARRLRRALHEARQHRRLHELNRELAAAVTEKDALLEQKDVLVKEVNHRVQNSLQLVSAFLSLQSRAAGNAEVAAHLAEAQSRLSAVALVHRRLYRDDQLDTVDLARYLEELAGDVKGSLGARWASLMRTELAPVLIATDRAISLGLILTELVINATKYAYGGDFGPIAITLEQHRATLRLIVADEGRGKIDAGSGFGSRMMASLIAGLGGTIDYRDNRPGLRAVVSAPIEV